MEKTDSSEKFIQFIRSILDKPAMFLVNNVEDLHLVLFGYCAASGFGAEQFLSEFRRYVNSEFEPKSDFDWARIIRFQSGRDKSSLDLFRVKFEEFMKNTA